MHEETVAYGLWSLAIINSLIFIIFAFSFTRPTTKRDWRSFGAFSAFIVALFAEMYGFPLTIYFLSGWLYSQFPHIDFMSHDAGHLLEIMFGWEANPHFGPFHLLSNFFIVAGFILLAVSWKVLYEAQKNNKMAIDGVYSRIRHPQYAAFIAIMLGFLIQWPTLLTLAMFPVLTFMYVRLARQEEKDSVTRFGDAYRSYMQSTPAFIPKWGARQRASAK